MITLPNGDKWIVDSREWRSMGITYEESLKADLPATTYMEFVEKFCEERCLPEKLVSYPNGKRLWVYDLDVFKEVFSAICIEKTVAPWCEVYKMPWGHITVKYLEWDDDRIEFLITTALFRSEFEYKAAYKTVQP